MNKVKTALLIIALVAVATGLVYYGLKVKGMKDTKEPVPTPIQTTTPTTEATTVDESTPIASWAPTATNVNVESFRACNMSDDCTVIAQPGTADNGKKVKKTYCTNKNILTSCPECKSNTAINESVAEEATCGCVSNRCEFEPM